VAGQANSPPSNPLLTQGSVESPQKLVLIAHLLAGKPPSPINPKGFSNPFSWLRAALQIL